MEKLEFFAEAWLLFQALGLSPAKRNVTFLSKSDKIDQLYADCADVDMKYIKETLTMISFSNL